MQYGISHALGAGPLRVANFGFVDIYR